MAILKYGYLLLGWVFFGFINLISYTYPTFQGSLDIKILFSGISLVLLILDNLIILKSEWIFKRPFKQFQTYHQIMFYLGIFVIPLISLYYQS
ncbi:MAG: hypothetical protein C4537_04595 [Acholeplasma sp.]|jgi:hypothetical protein|nr:MAG: hypothetical protein C4537_04595 [Acholeplasma sp.]